MTLSEYLDSVTAGRMPPDLSPALRALWHDRAGDWDEAHRIAQDIDDSVGARVHAYLHRKEGDSDNAGYWYRRAQCAPFRGSLDDEWADIVSTLTPAT
ncbi:MAG: hypothetical protein ABI051_16280 [Vicinamibacterales bacterium]